MIEKRSSEEKPDLRRSAKSPVYILKMFICSAALLCTSRCTLYPSARDIRVLRVRIALDEDFQDSAMKEVQISRCLRKVSLLFREEFGLAFKSDRIEYWEPQSLPKSFPALMDDLRRKVAGDEVEIVMGLVSSRRTSSPSLGIADFDQGFVLIKDIPSEELMLLVMAHEISHLFGAVDLNERHCIMAVREPRLRFDDFTRRVISAHAGRMFDPAMFPMQEYKIPEIMELYKKRADLDRNEVEIHIHLVNLSLEWINRRSRPGESIMFGLPDSMNELLEDAISHCEKAILLRPDLPEVHNLLGAALASCHRWEEAKSCFQKALDLNPEYLEGHYNLGIANLRLQTFPEAVAHLHRVVDINPGFGLAYLRLAEAYEKQNKERLAEKFRHLAEKMGAPVAPSGEEKLQDILYRER